MKEDYRDTSLLASFASEVATRNPILSKIDLHEMNDDLLLVLVTIKALWPPCLPLPFWTCGFFANWSCWIAAYRLSTAFSALLE